MSDVKFNCPHCSQSLEAPEEMLGQLIDCPSCQKPIEVPFPRMAPKPSTIQRAPETAPPPLRPPKPQEPRQSSPAATPPRGKSPLLILAGIVAILMAIAGALFFGFRSDPKGELQGIASRIEGSQYKFVTRDQPDVIHSVAYDVRKTESVVSPYMGSVVFHLWNYDFEAIFAYQDGKWVLKKVNGDLGFVVEEHIQALTSQYYGIR